MDTQQDRIEIEPISQVKCVQCGKQLDVSQLASFSSFTCPECGEQQVVPALFGGFLLLGRLGSGGMGVIYHALDKELGRHVALKVMKKSLGENAEFVESFRHEARAAAALNHRNVVQIYSFGQHAGQPYIVMELVDGGRLDEMIVQEYQLNEERALEVHIEVAEGLKAASEVGLVHGDVKPANILFGVNGEAKVVDFGLASFIGQQKEEGGQIWGTPYYIAPEKARRQKHDFRSDIYSLGATLFHALAGEPPFDGTTPLDVVLARLNNPAPDIMQFRADLHPKTAAMVARMLETAPTMRYPSYAALLYDMREALSKTREPPVQSRRMRRTSADAALKTSFVRSHLTTGAVALALLILAAGGIYGNVKYQEHKARLAAEAAEKENLEKARLRAAKTFSRMQDLQSVILKNVDAAKAGLENIAVIARTVKGAVGATATASNHIERIDQALFGASEALAKASNARYGLEMAADSRSAFDIVESLEKQVDELQGHLRVTAGVLTAVEEELALASALQEKERLAAEAEREKKRKEQEQARLLAEKKKAEEEAKRRAELERQEAEQVRRETLQLELDMLDEARSANRQLVAERKFVQAASALTPLGKKLSMPESQALHKNMVDSYNAIARLMQFLVSSIGQSPYPQGWQLGDSRRDIVQADIAEGLKIALGEAGTTVIPWESVTLANIMQITRYYIDKMKLSDKERASLLLSAGLLCYESGDFRRAKSLAELSVRADPEIKSQVDRLMPGYLVGEAE